MPDHSDLPNVNLSMDMLDAANASARPAGEERFLAPELSDADAVELLIRFNHHPPRADGVAEQHAQAREILRNAAAALLMLHPEPSAERTLAIRKLEEGMFWMNAAIARRGARATPGNPSGRPTF